MRRLMLSLSGAAGLALLLVAAPAEQPDPKIYVEHVRQLASPKLGGRAAGTPGLEAAARYIEERFRKSGLRPGGERGSYRQALTVTTSAKSGPGNLISANGQTLELEKDYVPLSFSSNGRFQGGVVFAGYGITAPERQYDDYAHLDVTDKIVLVLRHEPPSFRKDTGGKEKAPTHHAQLISKAINARNRGAKAVILVNGVSESQPEDVLIKFGSVAGPDDAGILMVQAKNAVADGWLKAAAKNVTALQKQINAKPEPASFALPESFTAAVQVDVKREQARVHNILGYLPGKSKEYVIVGAHYDHLGHGNESSLAPSQIGQVHPGADDNASGTAGLLELARVFAARRGELERGLLFAAFAAEEIGLLGSSTWANHPTLPLSDAAAMLNMDMIGRVSGSKLYIGGTGSGSTFDALLKQATAGSGFQIEQSQDAFSASDHTSFAAKKIPVLFFFSGLHSDYHKPGDTWEKIDGKSAVRVVSLVAEVASRLVTAPERPQFVRMETGHGGGMPGGGGTGYGAYFGSIPDFGPVENGVKFADVRAGSPADKAGLKGGDILVQFGDKPIKNLYDFTFVLRGAKPGDVVEVRVLRDGKPVTASVKLEQRR